MTNDLLCYACLVNDPGATDVPAVTIQNGTALCERHARARAEKLEQDAQAIAQHHADITEQFSQAGRPRRLL